MGRVEPGTIVKVNHPREFTPKSPIAKGVLRESRMNKLETRYRNYLEGLKYAGEILWYCYEGIKLRLADNTTLTVDFPLMLANGELEMHECKGWWRDDARVKIKVAAALYPFRFIGIRDINHEWVREEL